MKGEENGCKKTARWETDRERDVEEEGNKRNREKRIRVPGKMELVCELLHT